jgi:hypothetical protein
LGFAYAYEQASKKRIVPKFKTALLWELGIINLELGIKEHLLFKINSP